MIQTQSVSVDGISTPVRMDGNAAGAEAVVFVHGNPGAGEDWLDALPRVGAFARAVAPDMPGYGQGARPREFDYTVHGYARHLDGILAALDIRRAHLVLHDFGGPWGLQWAAEHPDRVASLVLVNVGILPGYRWHKYARIWRTPVLGELFQLSATRSGLRTLLNADNPKPLPKAFTDRIHRAADWGHKRAVLKLYRATSDLGGFSTRIAAALEPLALPTLVIWGEGDRYLPVRYAQVQKDYFDAQVRTMPGCGHWPMIDDPEKFAELLTGFLRERVAAAAGG
jgi:pimeloyl-ACP methyl ester carboxylesterase